MIRFYLFLLILIVDNQLLYCSDCCSKNKRLPSTSTTTDVNKKIFDGKIFVYCLDDNVKNDIESIFKNQISDINKTRNIKSADVEYICNDLIKSKYKYADIRFCFTRVLDNKTERNWEAEVDYPYEIHYIPFPKELDIDVNWISKNTKLKEQEFFDSIKNKYLSKKNGNLSVDELVNMVNTLAKDDPVANLITEK